MTEPGAAKGQAAIEPPRADTAPGAALPAVEIGPLVLADFVRWAAYQENWFALHYDRAFAQQHGLRDCIQSGHHRTALLTRMITDWLGPSGWLKRLAVRHRAPVFVGETIRCEGRVRGAGSEGGRVVELDVWVVTPDGRRASEGTAAVELYPEGQR
ncbi:MAG TPA: MaoC/PaaZ C-terminal domain-containing protein [bacterium]|nr:MaoC/PaaZ C-terminal domain-containing protein [bacterium]